MDRRIQKKIQFTTGILIFCLILLYHLSVSQVWKNYGYALYDPWNVRIYTLKNGLKVFLCPDTTRPEIAGIITVKAGSAMDPDDATGLAHYLEHMLFKGTRQLGTVNYEAEKKYLEKIRELFEWHRKTTDPAEKKKIYRRIDSLSYLASRYAIPNEYDHLLKAMGAKEYNAFTSEDQTTYYTVFPSNQLRRWVLLESERFCDPVFRIFHTELEAVYEEKNITLSSDNDKLWYAALKGVFTPLPYSRKTTIGEIDHLKNPSIVEIEKYFKNYYVANNMGIILCGNFHPDTAITLIDKFFSRLPSGNIPVIPSVEPAPLEKPYKKITVRGKDRETIFLCWRIPPSCSSDHWKLKILTRLLQNSYSGLLDKEIEKTGMGSGIECTFYSLREGAFAGIFVNPESVSADSLNSYIRTLIHTFCLEKISESILRSTIINQKKKFLLEYENALNKGFLLADLFGKDISWQRYLDDFRYLDSIKPEDIQKLAQEIFLNKPYVFIHKIQAPDTVTVSIEKPEITPIYSGQQPHSTLYKKILSIPVTSIQPMFYQEGKHYFRSQIHTGIRFLSTAHTSHKLIHLKLVYPNTVIPDSVHDWLSFALLHTSSPSSSSRQWNAWLYENGIECIPSVRGNEFCIEFMCLQEQKDSLLKYIDFLMNKAEIAQEDLSVVQKKYTSWYSDSSIATLLHFMDRYTCRQAGIYSGRVMSPEIASKLAPLEIRKNFFSKLSSPQRVFYAGALRDTGIFIRYFRENYRTVNSVKPSALTKMRRDTVLVFVTPNPQTLINIYYPISNVNNLHLPFIKFLERTINLFLYQKIREEKALAYDVHCVFEKFIHPNQPYVLGHLFLGTQSDKTSDALSSLQFHLKNFPFSEQEFIKAKKSLLETENASRKNNLLLCESMYFLSLFGETAHSQYHQFKNMKYHEAKSFFEETFTKSPKIYSLIIPDIKYIRGSFASKSIRTVSPAEIR